MNIKELAIKGSELLLKITNSPYLEAELLLAHVLKQDKSYLVSNSDVHPTGKEVEQYFELITIRKTGKPIAYILNIKEFFGLEFLVNESTLVPRPETELLVELVLDYIKENNCKSLIDIGTGSGCIAITLLFHSNLNYIHAIDLSNEAVETARLNARNLLSKEMRTLIEFKQADMFTYAPEYKFDLIVSNPPYIPTKEIDTLAKDLSFEPRSALDGGEDGLDYYRRLATLCSDNTYSPKGFFEIHSTLASETRDIFENKGLSIKIHKDLANRYRVIEVN